MSSTSPSSTSGQERLTYPKSLFRFCQPTLHADNPEEAQALSRYLGPINDSEAFLAALISHEAKTPRRMLSDQRTKNDSRLAFPLNAKNPGILIELNSTWLNPTGKFVRTITTRFEYYQYLNAHEELREQTVVLGNSLFYAFKTREFMARFPEQARVAADQVLTELSYHEGCIDLGTGACLVEGTAKWAGTQEPTVILEFPLPSKSGGTAGRLQWAFTKEGLSAYPPGSRVLPTTMSDSQKRQDGASSEGRNPWNRSMFKS